MLRERISVACLVLALAPVARGQERLLLTENGLQNPEFSEYQGVQRVVTGGSYEANPPFSGGEEGASFSFAEGVLTNGDSTFNHKREPMPYAYWQGLPQGELTVNLGRMCHIGRLRLCLLSREEGPHGTKRVEVHAKGDPLEFPDILKVGLIEPVEDGWNELNVDRDSDGLRLMFARADGKTYITVSEIEIWGRALEAAGETPSVSSADPKRTEDGITWWAFDFGPADSPPFAQFHVTDSKAAYSPDRGFGWIPYQDGQPATESNFGPASAVVPGLGERDRGGAAVDPLYRDLVMTSEYYHTQVRQTFAVDVPNGTYLVMTMHGDVQYGRVGRQSYWIEAEGKTAVDDIELDWSRTTDATFEVAVEDGRLDLTFDAKDPDPAKRGFAINGLAVFPADTAEQRGFAERKVAMIRAAIERTTQQAFERSFTEVPYEETGEMVEPSEADRARGFVAWTPNWMERIYPNSVPEAADVERRCTTFAAPGEYEPVSVAVRALRDLEAVRVKLGDLTGDAGRIPAESLEIRKVRCWPQRIGSSWSTEYQVMPELLELFESVDIAADQTQEFWLTIHVPDAAAAGNYAGPVRVTVDDGGEWETTLGLQVLPFRLARAERPVGMYWRDEQWEPERLDKELRDMVEHGVTAVTLSRAPTIENVDGKLVADTSELLAFLQHLKQLGIEGPIPYYPGLDGLVRRAFPEGDFDAQYVEAIRQLEEVSSRDDTPKLLHYPVDEIGNSDERGEKAAHLCSLTAQVPGATSYITVNNYEAGEKWGDSFDIWCGNIEYTADQEQRLLERGKRYMRYGPAYLNSCRKARNSSGFGFYRRPAEAHYYWHYQAFNRDPFNDFDGTARDWCAAYPGPDGPIPTLDWEAIREGIDDLRYIATLKQLAAQAENGNAAQRQAAARARDELKQVLALDATVNQYDFAADLADDEFSDLRRRLADRIIELTQVP